MEPWLDSLSDEWASNKQSSSPSNSNLTPSRASSRASSHSQSRIPNLSQKYTQGSRNGSFLRPRSSQGLARAKKSSVLAEQTSSELNVAAKSHNNAGRSILPRRASSAYSGSIRSVQHYTIEQRSSIGNENIPEWKRRLARGEDVGSDGCDLFGPTRLEGIFKQPLPSSDGLENVPQPAAEPLRPWSMPEQYQSMRASRSRIPEMEILAEEDEDNTEQDSVGTRGELTPRRSLKGVVRDRVISFEHNSVSNKGSQAYSRSLRDDSRMRTSSGQEEIRNEEISLITSSKQNTIREEAVKLLTQMPANILHSEFDDQGERPSSRASDDGVSYGHAEMQYEDFGEMTSLSLPDDLSMGTQDFATRGGFVNSRRGGRSNEGSFQKKALSSSLPASVQHSIVDSENIPFRSSPPPFTTTRHAPQEGIEKPAVSPTTPRRLQGSDDTDRPRSSGSPLKLFGNYDTFTNDKLLRRMSQFDHDDSADQTDSQNNLNNPEYPEGVRISHFGKGDLDKFTFDERVERQIQPLSSLSTDEARIFEDPSVHQWKVQSHSPTKSSNTDAQNGTHAGKFTLEAEPSENKRMPSSSIKDRTPKRRRTLIQGNVDAVQQAVLRPLTISSGEANQLAGKKRKDARYDNAESTADPHILAARQMIKPKASRQRSSDITTKEAPNKIEQANTSESEDEITEELADELVSFGIGITRIANDSRKPSVTTQDFLNEATKIMQIIRQRGKPKSGLRSVEEPREEKELNPDSILDLEVEGDETTVENFSRPPSRNGSIQKRKERAVPLDPDVVSQLQKYQDGDELDLLLTSKLGSLCLLPDRHAEEAAEIPLPEGKHSGDEENVSSPANIRIRPQSEHQLRREQSTSTLQGPHSLPTQASSGTSSGATLPTCSSSSSGFKGRIPPGMVPVPEHVGAMTFDHSTKSWVRGKPPQASPSSRKSNSEEDPFGDIPDLSVDEQKEVQRNALSDGQVDTAERESGRGSTESEASRPQTREGAQILPSETATGASKFTRLDSSMPIPETRATSWGTADLKIRPTAQVGQAARDDTLTDHDEEVEHEIRIHDGRVSEAPPSPHRTSKKARAVTIAFSSPLVSAIAYHTEHSLLDLEESLASGDVGEDMESTSPLKRQSTSTRVESSANGKARPPAAGRRFVGRPVSRIDEQEEDIAGDDRSLVHVSQSNAMTPARKAPPPATRKAPSVICLTPLSEFSVHQSDQPQHLETSYVAQRAHPTSLQQAHGSLALAVDSLMKAITDAEPYELYWEHIRRLDLTGKKLTTLHRLGEYCSSVEELHASGNELSQLSGIPYPVRTLSARSNHLSSLTSWGHLQNLQYLDISGNSLESLDGLSCLRHLRELKANHNHIHNLDGIFDLDALLHLELQGNQLTVVDFEGAELTRLAHLDLCNNQLAAVNNIGVLPALRTLHAEKNNLIQFGHIGGRCPTLRDLRLSFNQVQEIDLGLIPSVEVLYLDNNRIQSIQGLGTARHLNTLSLREQSDSPHILSTIFSSPHECRKLYLSSNLSRLEGLEMPLRPHLNLKYLELASCGLTCLPKEFGRKMPNCRTLNLNFNAIPDLEPLKGCERLNKLLVAGNRLSKLRRTCIALTRLPALTKGDVRDNPLTVGFHPPFREGRLVVHGEAATDAQDPYSLPPVDQAMDSKWVRHLDEGTRLKRRTMELFLAKGCEKMIELDGLGFDRVALLEQDEVWRMLTSMGVITKVCKEMSPAQSPDDDYDVGVEEEALPLDAEADAEHR